MKRLIRKYWYSLTDAASYLTQSTEGGEIKASDVLQLVVDCELELSIRILSETKAEIGDIVWLKDKEGEITSEDMAELIFHSLPVTTSESVNLACSQPIAPLTEGPLCFIRDEDDIDSEVMPGPIWILTGYAWGERLQQTLWGLSLSSCQMELDQPVNLISNIEATSPGTEPLESTKELYFLHYPEDDENNIIYKVLWDDLPKDTLVGITGAELERFLASIESNSTAISTNKLEALPDDFHTLYQALGAGDLPHLDLLITCWRNFWKGRTPNDGKNYPVNSEVIKWIENRMDKPERSHSKAKMIASIIRPTWAPKGRQPGRNL